MFEVKFTGQRYTQESLAEGIAAETGWIDPAWSMMVVHAEAEDVRSGEFDTLEEAEAYITEHIGSVHPERGSYYANDTVTDDETGDVWTHAGHITEV